MKITKNSKIIILGSGPAGCTAAIYASRANLNPILITGTNIGGQLTNTDQIENWPGEINDITGLDLMKRMHKHVCKFDATMISDNIISVDFQNHPFRLTGEKNEYISDSVIIATGSNPRYLGLKSEKIFKGKGISTCAICDGFFYRNRNVAVIGGGNTAIEETLYLSNIVNKVYLIHRGSTFSAEKILVQRLKKKIQNKKIIIYFNCNVKEIFGDSSGITEILVMQTNPKILTTFKIKISGLFIAIGHVPNTDIFLNQIETQNGYIKTMHKEHGNFTQTSIPGIFAAGDVIDHVYKQAITSSASGCMAALDAEKYLANLL